MGLKSCPDFWENDFSKRPQEQVAQSLPVLVTIFNTRLKLLELYLGEKTLWVFETQRVCADLRAQIALIPTDSFSVKLVNAYQFILEQHTSPDILEYDEQGWPHNLVGDLLTNEQRAFLQGEAFRGYDNDSGMTMLRIGSMNLMLHGIEYPRFFYMDTLSKDFTEAHDYDVILMNPPFKGAVDKGSVSDTLPGNTRKSELLFVHLILRVLDMGGRCAVIVPDGVLFGSSRAHVELRRKLIEENRLDGVVSMPGGVFKPYAGVSTAVLLFTRGATTDRVWFYDMAYDGFSLDDKRKPVPENDIPDILECWHRRHDADFQATRQARLEELQAQVAPLKIE